MSYNTKNYTESGGERTVVGGSLDVASGGEIDIESGGSLKLAGTAITSTAAELNKLDGCTKTVAELNSTWLTGEIADISTAASSWVVSPIAGTVGVIYTVIDGAITVGDATVTFEIGGVAITGGSITIANAGSAAGTVDTCTCTAANTVAAGGAIEIITDGGSTDAAKAVVLIQIVAT